MRPRPFVVLALVCTAGTAGAQGTLSGQGFGFAPGQLGTRALAMGGAAAEMDPVSPLNPAALAGWGRTALYFQYEPEYRRVHTGDASDRTSIVRFPVVAGAVPVGRGVVIGLSASTLLDRTGSASVERQVLLHDSTMTAVQRFRSTGAINDIRLAAGWRAGPSISVGLGVHAITGENRLEESLEFASDSARSYQSSFAISFGGSALSAGVAWQPSGTLGFGGSVRLGGRIRSYRGDSVLTSGRVPRRVGLGARYTGISGADIGIQLERQEWSSLAPLGRPGESSLRSHDAWMAAAGAEIEGPQWFETTIPIRAGARWRVLPFSHTAEQVRELAFAGGLAVPLARNRARLDMGIQRASFSSAGSDVGESAWTLSAGLLVRP